MSVLQAMIFAGVQHGNLLNVSGGTLIKSIGGVGGGSDCSRSFNPDCATANRTPDSLYTVHHHTVTVI